MHHTLLKLFPDFQFGDWVLQDDSDGNGVYIKQWNRPEPQPTLEEIEAAALIPDPEPSFEERVAANTAAIQAEMDRQAKAKGYDNILSACSYAAQAVGAPFQAEGAAFLQWRSDVWTQAYAVLADVQAGLQPLPTIEEAVAAMPVLVLP